MTCFPFDDSRVSVFSTKPEGMARAGFLEFIRIARNTNRGPRRLSQRFTFLTTMFS
jgi:hypothetical protein